MKDHLKNAHKITEDINVIFKHPKLAWNVGDALDQRAYIREILGNGNDLHPNWIIFKQVTVQGVPP
jgi:hypothetical protein